MSRAIYVLHTADAYELPLFVGDAEEMSSLMGCSIDTLRSKVSKQTVDRKFNAMVKRVFSITGGEAW